MAKASDRRHVCEKIKAKAKRDPVYVVCRLISDGKWDVWIPDFLRPENTTVKAFVWGISFCPFCGCDLKDEKNSKPW